MRGQCAAPRGLGVSFVSLHPALKGQECLGGQGLCSQVQGQQNLGNRAVRTDQDELG